MTDRAIHPLDGVAEYSKWPRLLVVGDQVTREQANEIIVRTTRLWGVMTNDAVWEKLVKTALKLPPDLTHEDYAGPVEARLEKINEREALVEARERRLRTLDLHYMDLSDRIASCYVEGPHGWCDWSGHIFTDSYNIGKWPTAREVHCDLETIAAAFPFLRMTVQALSERYHADVPDPEFEDCGTYIHDETTPITWTVANGEVTYVIADVAPITPPRDAPLNLLRFMDPKRERGVEITRLYEAVAQVERTYGPPKNDDEESDDGDE